MSLVDPEGQSIPISEPLQFRQLTPNELLAAFVGGQLDSYWDDPYVRPDPGPIDFTHEPVYSSYPGAGPAPGCIDCVVTWDFIEQSINAVWGADPSSGHILGPFDRYSDSSSDPDYSDLYKSIYIRVNPPALPPIPPAGILGQSGESDIVRIRRPQREDRPRRLRPQPLHRGRRHPPLPHRIRERGHGHGAGPPRHRHRPARRQLRLGHLRLDASRFRRRCPHRSRGQPALRDHRADDGKRPHVPGRDRAGPRPADRPDHRRLRLDRPGHQPAPDALTGFLPPEDGTGRGQGFISYIVEPKTGLPTGATIRNIARITFDANDPIDTNQVDPHDASKGTDPAKEAFNTIDAGPPTSSVDRPAAS